MTFQLDDRLAKDTVEVINLDLSYVGLMLDQRFPWLIVVPRRAGLVELSDLNSNDRQRLLDEAVRCSKALQAVFPESCKMNVAALGNMVRQLHVHVIARRETDGAWPGPVWGVGTPVPYASEARDQLIDKLNSAIAASA